MLNSNLVLKKIPLPIYSDYRILNSNITEAKTKVTVMIPITEKEEENIDNIDNSVLIFIRGKRKFSVTMKDIYCYGEVNFTDRETLDKIENFNFLNYLGEVGVHIYSNYDYTTHSCSTSKKTLLWTETWSPAELAKMAHGYLGKPDRILLFSQNLK